MGSSSISTCRTSVRKTSREFEQVWNRMRAVSRAGACSCRLVRSRKAVHILWTTHTLCALCTNINMMPRMLRWPFKLFLYWATPGDIDSKGYWPESDSFHQWGSAPSQSQLSRIIEPAVQGRQLDCQCQFDLVALTQPAFRVAEDQIQRCISGIDFGIKSNVPNEPSQSARIRT